MPRRKDRVLTRVESGMGAILERSRRAIWAYGLTGAARRAIGALRHPAAHHADTFDRRRGTDTSDIVRLEGLRVIGSNKRYGVRYQASDADAAHVALAALPIRHEDFTFVDIGAGKGRALLVAAEFPFKRVIGVEFAEELCQIARRNARLAGHNRIEVVCEDAAAYELPEDPLVLYFYNPFLPALMRQVMERVDRSLVAHPRPAYAVLFGDELAGELEAAEFTRVGTSAVFAR